MHYLEYFTFFSRSFGDVDGVGCFDCDQRWYESDFPDGNLPVVCPNDIVVEAFEDCFA